MKPSKSILSINTSESGVAFADAFHNLFSIIPAELLTKFSTDEWNYPPDGHLFLKKPINFNALFENVYYQVQFIIKNNNAVDPKSKVEIVGNILFEAKILGGAQTIILMSLFSFLTEMRDKRNHISMI